MDPDLKAATIDAGTARLESHLRAAIDHLNAGDLAAAEAVCEALLGETPTHPAVLQLRATIALRAGRVAEARRSAEQSLRLRPGHVPTLQIALRAALASHAPDRAAELLRGAPRPATGHSVQWQDIGIAFQRAGQPTAALDCFDRARTADAALAPAAWFALGLAQQDLGDEAAAASAYERALSARPDLAEAAVNLGIARQRLGDMDAAMAAYRRAVAARPDTFGRIAQAVTASSTGMLWLEPAALRRALGA